MEEEAKINEEETKPVEEGGETVGEVVAGEGAETVSTAGQEPQETNKEDIGGEGE